MPIVYDQRENGKNYREYTLGNLKIREYEPELCYSYGNFPEGQKENYKKAHEEALEEIKRQGEKNNG